MHVEGGLEQNFQGEPDDHEHEQHVEGHVLSGIALRTVKREGTDMLLLKVAIITSWPSPSNKSICCGWDGR